jgi:hypothetical protein
MYRNPILQRSSLLAIAVLVFASTLAYSQAGHLESDTGGKRGDGDLQPSRFPRSWAAASIPKPICAKC